MSEVLTALNHDIKRNDIPFDYKMGAILVVNRIMAQYAN